METLALRWLLVACCTVPFVVAALQARRAGTAAGWWAVALLAAALSVTADPMAVALRQVDGVMTRATCGT